MIEGFQTYGDSPEAGDRLADGRQAGEGSSLRPLLAVAVGFIVLTIVGLAVVLIPLGVTHKASDSPQVALQQFVNAVNDRNWQKADSYLSLRLIKTGHDTSVEFADKYGVAVMPMQVIKQADNAAIIQASFTYKDTTMFHPATPVEVDFVVEGNSWKIDSAFWVGFNG